MVDKGLLQRMELLVRTKTFDRKDLPAVGGDRRHQTGRHRPPVHNDGARAAFANSAALLGSQHSEIFSEEVRQNPVRGDFGPNRSAIDVA